MAPFDVVADLGTVAGYMIFTLIGIGFGAVLELSGFGDSRKLAAQFYFRDLTVLKVMFTGIVVAMLLLFLSSALGILNFDRIWVNPTYLWPGIVGGLLMGVGFIIGGFCPGTSVVALSTLKIDGMFFVGGVTAGVFLFGESVFTYDSFYHSSFMGRFMLPELFGIPAGVVVLLVVIMALAMFYGAELLEQRYGKNIPWKEIEYRPPKRAYYLGGGIMLFLAVVTLALGQPAIEEKWEWIRESEQRKIDRREIQVHPGELLQVMNDPLLYTSILDVRTESDFNLFHLENARNVSFRDLRDRRFVDSLNTAPGNTIHFIVSNNESRSIAAYRLLKAQGVFNLYILEGGINRWLELFPPDPAIAVRNVNAAGDDPLKFAFTRSVGAGVKSANPRKEMESLLKNMRFTKKVKIRRKNLVTGGCG